MEGHVLVEENSEVREGCTDLDVVGGGVGEGCVSEVPRGVVLSSLGKLTTRLEERHNLTLFGAKCREVFLGPFLRDIDHLLEFVWVIC